MTIMITDLPQAALAANTGMRIIQDHHDPLVKTVIQPGRNDWECRSIQDIMVNYASSTHGQGTLKESKTVQVSGELFVTKQPK